METMNPLRRIFKERTSPRHCVSRADLLLGHPVIPRDLRKADAQDVAKDLLFDPAVHDARREQRARKEPRSSGRNPDAPVPKSRRCRAGVFDDAAGTTRQLLEEALAPAGDLLRKRAVVVCDDAFA